MTSKLGTLMNVKHSYIHVICEANVNSNKTLENGKNALIFVLQQLQNFTHFSVLASLVPCLLWAGNPGYISSVHLIEGFLTVFFNNLRNLTKCMIMRDGIFINLLCVCTGIGSSYVRWGRTTCPEDNELTYKGNACLIFILNCIKLYIFSI